MNNLFESASSLLLFGDEILVNVDIIAMIMFSFILTFARDTRYVCNKYSSEHFEHCLSV